MLERVREEADADAAISGAADLRERAGVHPAGLTSTPNEAGARSLMLGVRGGVAMMRGRAPRRLHALLMHGRGKGACVS